MIKFSKVEKSNELIQMVKVVKITYIVRIHGTPHSIIMCLALGTFTAHNLAHIAGPMNKFPRQNIIGQILPMMFSQMPSQIPTVHVVKCTQSTLKQVLFMVI